MVDNEGPIRLTPSMLPDSLSFDVKDSSFFRKWPELPSPQDVQAKAKSQHLAGVNPDPRKVYRMDGPYASPPPVIYEDMGLFIKWGSSVEISEALTLFALRRLLNGRVPFLRYTGGAQMEMKNISTWNTSEGRAWRKHGIPWSPMTGFRSAANCAQYMTVCVNLSRTLRTHSWVCKRGLQASLLLV
jgi:hypothetical protein